MTPRGTIRYREAADDAREAFLALGHRPRSVFAHRAYFIPACGPDALKLSGAMCGLDDPDKVWVIVLHATDACARGLPTDLFFDPDLVWHQEHYGLPGHVAFAMAVLDGDHLRVLNCVSDLVQRQSRRPEFSTRIDRLFRGWPYMLFNALLVFARDRGVRYVHSPAADFVMRHTDRTRSVGPGLFVRVYDRTPSRYGPVRRGDWWVIDVAANVRRIVALRVGNASTGAERTICLCHDVERGLGHLDVDPRFAEAADRASPGALARMLAIERESGVRGTYNVVARLLGDVRERIETGRHALGFHSYDHSIRRFSPALWLRVSRTARRWQRRARLLHMLPVWSGGAGLGRAGAASPGGDRDALDQPALCRHVDARIRGYRPPQSRITYELNDFNLVSRNYRWLASSVGSLGFRAPRLENRLVKIPIALDDFPLHTRRLSYVAWKRRVLAQAEGASFSAISLHDCYASEWLPDYPNLLGELARLGSLRTLDEVAAECVLRECV